MDIRMKTYEEEVKEYRNEAPVQSDALEPENFIREHGLTPSEGVNPADYPAGTWFVYFEGETYVKR